MQKEIIDKHLLEACKMASDYINNELGNDKTVSRLHGYNELDIHFLTEAIDSMECYNDSIETCLDCGEKAFYSDDEIHTDMIGNHVICVKCKSSFDVSR